MKDFKKTCLRVDLGKIIHNYRLIQKSVGPKVRVMPVLKADAYGLGVKEIVAVLPDLQGVCVATIQEGVALRRLRPDLEIVVLSGMVHGALKTVLRYRLTPVIFEASMLSHLLQQKKKKLEVYLKIDSGMNRLGINKGRKKAIHQLLAAEHIHLKGVISHFSSANDGDDQEVARQLGRIKDLGHSDVVSFANSAAILAYPDSHCAMVRPGLSLLGVSPFRERIPGLKPVVRLTSRIIQIKTVKKGETVGYSKTYQSDEKRKIAVVAIGYADGLSTRMSNRGYFLIRGQRAPIVGRVSMDLTTVDVGYLDGVALGDRVVIIGKSGKEQILVEDVACWSEKSGYEILCNMGIRVRRKYKKP